jgi:protein-S-isoprenylcysteine O-methyltransferase Ste14
MNLELVKTIVILPGTALVYVPGAILWMSAEWGLAADLADPARPRFWCALALGAAGLAFAAWTTDLLRVVGKGTPAPWAPPSRLVVRGPYRHVRNPMITGVLLMLAPEALMLGS